MTALRQKTNNYACRLLFLTGAMLPAAIGRGEVALWVEPEIDTWVYTDSSTSGTREFGPTFGAFDIDSTTNEFTPGSDQEPTRRGTALIAFETDDQVVAGLNSARYAINSATVTVWGTRTGEGDLIYSEQPITPASLLSEALAGPISSQQPVELFGVGFTNGLEGFELGVNSGAGSDYFSESTEPYDGANGPYQVYPVVGDGQGGYSDVSNSLSGGFSVTAPGNTTGAFDATPWAIGNGFSVDSFSDPDLPGTAYEEGDVLPLLTRYEFSLDLSAPGVEAYLQQGLADGALGFTISSVHRAGQPGVPGGGAYLDWRLKEAFGNFSPRLSVDFTILPDSLPGDANGDGSVDLLDLDVLGTNFGIAEGATFAQGDFNNDGAVDLLDLDILGTNFGTTATAFAVPEPGTSVLTLAGIMTVAFCVGTVTFTTPRRRR